MTLKELAGLAGVSVSTVSRVVNKNDVNAASEQVRNHIWDLVQQTGYIPNPSAQNLKRGFKPDAEEKHSIVCVFARTPDGKTDPFFSQIFRSIEHECIKCGYEMTGVYTALNLKSAEKEIVRPHNDGIIVLGRYSRALLSRLKSSSGNIVYTGLNPTKDPCDQVVCDGYAAAKEAVRYLHLLGHRSIGYVGEKTEEVRYKGYYDAMQEFHLSLRREHIVETEQSMQGGYFAGKKILTAISGSSEAVATRPTAIFCANDSTAVGALKAFQENRVCVPKEISIISIDNTDICQFSSPMLTSIHIPKEELGKISVRTLIDRVEGGHTLPLKIEIPFSLVVRESCVRPEP